MAGLLLETKFHVPRRWRGLVARPRLSKRLSRGADSALTLVSAPAGFGKTTLLAEWLGIVASEGRSVAWLSLDQRDNDPAVFWTYLVAALRTAAPGVGADALSTPAVAAAADRRRAGHPAQRPQRRSRTRSCWCSTTTTSSMHRDVQDGIAFLLEHLPPQIHLVIAGRADPTLPLARLARRVASSSRSAPLTCVSLPTRQRPTSTRSWDWR